MFKLFKRDKRTTLEKEIDGVIEIMEQTNPGTEIYSIMADNLHRLYEAKGKEPKRGISPDTIVLVAGNVLVVVLILTYEQTHIITTKALSFILRGRA
jgi:hypothetical protein